jgi:hypothetical protein
MMRCNRDHDIVYLADENLDVRSQTIFEEGHDIKGVCDVTRGLTWNPGLGKELGTPKPALGVDESRPVAWMGVDVVGGCAYELLNISARVRCPKIRKTTPRLCFALLYAELREIGRDLVPEREREKMRPWERSIWGVLVSSPLFAPIVSPGIMNWNFGHDLVSSEHETMHY